MGVIMGTILFIPLKLPLHRGGNCWAMKKMATSLNNLSKSDQRSPRSLNDRPVISTVATVFAVLTQPKTISQWSPKGSNLSMNTQQVLMDLSMISQRSFNESQVFQPQRRDSWEINERTSISHRNGFLVAFERSSPFLIAQWSPNALCLV